MASVKNRIVDYIVSASCLAATSGKPSGLTVRRASAAPSTAGAHPEVLVYVGPEVANSAAGLQREGSPALRAFTLLCEIRTNGGTSPDAALDPLEVWVEQRLFADETFGGLATGITGLRIEQDMRQLDKTYAMATVHADVQFVTVRGDPESQGS